ncbi:MAG: sigma-E processing peptidase SpoIIGA [Alicyclobacillaceae bacterium]|nr:sigma-E processing peptidase SpoIIGA [Alicyclobacillaceae bacterium]
MPVLYGDLVVAVNWCMDGLALWAAGLILRLRTNPLRLAGASALGAAYAFAVLFWPGFGAWWIRLAVSVAMVGLGLPVRRWISLLQGTVAFYLAAFVFAGAFVAVQEGAGGTVQTQGGVVLLEHTPVWIWHLRTGTFLAAVPAALALLYGLRRLKRNVDRLDGFLCRLEIATPLGAGSLPALLDSGNLLKEPLSGWPVIVVHAEEVRFLFPPELIAWARMVQSSADDLVPGRGFPAPPPAEEWTERIRIVPWRGVGGRRGWLAAVRPERIRVDIGGRRWTDERVYVAFQFTPLDSGGRYEAIVPGSVVAEAETLREGYR